MRRLTTLVAAGAAAALFALFIHLGLWQHGKAELRASELERHAQRSASRPQRLEPRALAADELADVRVSVQGRYVGEQQIFLDNRQQAGVPGVQVLTPLRLEGSDVHVWVNRGWTPWVNGRQSLPQVSTPQGLLVVSGRASVPSRKRFFLMREREEANGRLIMRVDLEALHAKTGLQALPVVLLQDAGDASDALVRNWPPPEDRVAMHRGYAFQWFALASAMALFVAFLLIRGVLRSRVRPR